MRILMMTNTYTPIVGGLERSIQLFAREFRRKKHKVLVVAPEFQGQPENEHHVIRLPALQKFNKTDFSVNLPIPNVESKLIESFHPTVVHAHHPFLMGDMAIRISGSYRIPLVFTYHIMFDQYTHYLPVDNEAAKRFIVELSVGFSNLCDYVVAPSESVRKKLFELGVERPVEVVPTGVEAKKMSKGNGPLFRKRWNIPKSAFVAGYAGRLAQEKNLIFLLEVVVPFLKKDKKNHFIFLGTGPMEGEMKRRFQTEGLQDSVHFPGVLKGQKLINGFHAMDVFVFASKSETQGMVVTEAMAAGLGVVALDAPGVRDVLQDSENGKLVPEENVQDFLSAINWVKNMNASKKMHLKKSSLKTADSFSVEKCAGKMLQVYERLGSASEMNTRKHQRNAWESTLGRIKAEWGLLMNLRKATGSALSESFSSPDAA